MHPYTVYVVNSSNKQDLLSIPCAEMQTAELVKKNLEGLFPGSSILIKERKHKVIAPLKNTQDSKTISFLNVKSIHLNPSIDENPQENSDFSVLEQNLFEDVA